MEPARLTTEPSLPPVITSDVSLRFEIGRTGKYTADMAKSDVTADGSLRKRAKVTAKEDIPSRQPGGQSVPAGMAGKVAMVSGFGPWIRYWVRFENGALIGSIDRDALTVPSLENAPDKSVSWFFR